VPGTVPCADAVATVTVVVVDAGDAGSNGSTTLCSSGPGEVLSSHLGGTPDATGTWTKPGGGILADGIYDPADPADPAGIYTYTITGVAPCPNVSATVQVVEHQAPQAGTDGSTTVCSTGASFDLGTVLGPQKDVGGTWWDSADASVASTFVPGLSTPGAFHYVVLGMAPCPNDTSFAAVNVVTAPEAGSNGSTVVCSDDGPFGLFPLLGGSPDTTGTWKDPNNASFNGTYVPGPAVVPGGYTYTVQGTSPCADASAVVTVSQHTRPVAGTDGTLELCSTDGPTDLFGSLGGSPDAGGTWTAPGGEASSGVFIPNVGGTFAYQYKVTGIAPCEPDSATVVVTVTQAPQAGGDGELTICSGQATVDLFTGLVGPHDFNGSWHDDDLTGRLSSNFFNPGSPGQLPAGHYDFTYVVPANGLCPPDSATVGVTIVAQLEAGSNGTVTVCSSQTQVDLFSGLSGTPQPGGTWTDLDNTGLVTGQYFNANGISGPGPYHFRYRLTGALGCASDSAVASVSVVAAPQAGTDATATFCSTGSPVSLSSYLGSMAQPNGTWRKPPPGNQVFGGTYNPPTFTPGAYTYTVNGVPPCANAVATIQVNETPGPNAGSPAATTVCSDGTPFNMTQRLGGSPDTTGTWTADNTPHSDIFVPGLDVPGVYLYTVTGTFPCGNETASLTVNVDLAPYAGADVTTTVCDNASNFLLFGLLEPSGAQANGEWFDPHMAPYPGPSYQPGSNEPGTYTYVVSGTLFCGVDSATVTVFETSAPNAGVNAGVSLCSNGASVPLVGLLTGADPTGTWVGPAPLDPYFSGIFQPGVSQAGTYTYRVNGIPPCANDSSTVTVAVDIAPDPGLSRSIVVCASPFPFAMVDSLGGTPALNGSWTSQPGGQPSNGIFTPATAGTFSFIYTVPGPVSCGPAQATLSITVNAAPNAGLHGELALCSTNGATPLLPSLGGSPQSGGTWSFQGISHVGSFDPNTDISGDYIYTVNGIAPCPNASATVTVTLNPRPVAGNNTILTICDDDQTPLVLGELLTGPHDNGGAWTLNGSPVSEIYLPSAYSAGIHTFTYTVNGQPPCPPSTAQVTIIQNAAPHAGNNAALAVCGNGPSVDLFSLLGNADPTGNWVTSTGTSAPSTFVPHDHASGLWTYYYVVIGSAPCANDTAKIMITVNHQPEAGVSTAPQLCTDTPPISLIDLLGGTPDPNGTWTFQPAAGPAVPHAAVFNPAIDVAGAYSYTVPGTSPCGNATATVQITLVTAPHAGADGSISVCASETDLSLFPVLNGGPDAGGQWTDNDGTGHLANGMFDPSAVGPGLYHFTYTVTGSGPCAAATATVSVTVTDALNAGTDSDTQLCSSETNADLFTYLDGSPQPGGAWTGMESGTGLTNGVLNAGLAGVGVHHYRYVLAGSGNCTPDTAILTVTVLNGPKAGNDGFITTCSNSTPIDLFNLLGGPHDLNGSWYYPDGGGVMPNSSVDPSSDPEGGYVYVVPAIGSCPADTAVVEVVIPTAPNAGVNGALSFCSDGLAGNLLSGLGGSPDSTGSWYFGTPPVLHVDTYDPSTDNPGPYTYRVPGQSPCATAVTTVNVSETAAPYAGEDNTYSLCSDAGSFSMLQHLAGNPQSTGFWRRSGTPSTPHTSFYNPAVDSSGTFLYIVNGAGPCANDTARLTINEMRAPQAGMTVSMDACPTDDAVDLFQALGPDADSTGIWTGPDGGLLADSLFDATQVPLGTYAFTYVVAATLPCANDTATVTVNVGSSLSVGTGGNDSICGGQTAYDLFNSLGGSPSAGGTWSEQTGVGAITDHYLDATSLIPGSAYAFVYTVIDPSCGPLSSVVDLFIAPFPDPGGDSSIIVCASDPSFPLIDALAGNPKPGGTWTDPSGATHDGTLDPAVDVSGVYTYHLDGTGFCSDTSAQVNVLVNLPADAGTDGAELVCNNGPVELFPLLGGSPQTGGIWSDLDGSGGLTNGTVDVDDVVPGAYGFRYRVDVEGCLSDSSNVTLQVVDGVTVQDIQRECNEQDRTYVVRFTLTGGDPAGYEVTGGEGALSDAAPYVFTSAPIFTSQPYAFFVDDENHCTPRTVEGTTPCQFTDDVFVPESFTPNGDGINDRFAIPGIEGFPNNSIVIFNRWGGEVYRASAYDNVHVVWDGSSPNALLPGDATTGTYYYVLDLGNGGDPLKGFVYLNR
jgi:gliding motility-associated-like protein